MSVITHRSIVFSAAALLTVLTPAAAAQEGQSTPDPSRSQPAIQSNVAAGDDDDAELVLAEPVEDGIVRATWQDSRDTSTVWGSVIESSVDANFVKPGAIAWLKIDVENTGAQAGPTGGVTLTRTTFIQRLNTDGGAAPSTGCDRPTDIGKKEFVPYAADYFFYTRK